MQIFDFDNTIYKGESVFDFAMFVIKRKKSLMKYIPGIVRLLFLYKICKMDVEEFQVALEKYSRPFLENQEFIEALIQEFWLSNIERLYPHMLKRIKPEDIIITSSPEFLIDGIKDVLNTDKILCSKLDLKNGKITFLNFADNKVKYLEKEYPNAKVDTLYTDSYNDKPLMEIARNVYLVKKGNLKKIK